MFKLVSLSLDFLTLLKIITGDVIILYPRAVSLIVLQVKGHSRLANVPRYESSLSIDLYCSNISYSCLYVINLVEDRDMFLKGFC